MDDVAQHKAQATGRVCSSCGAPLSAGAKFCATCGNWMGAAESVDEPPPVDEAVPVADPALAPQPEPEVHVEPEPEPEVDLEPEPELHVEPEPEQVVEDDEPKAPRPSALDGLPFDESDEVERVTELTVVDRTRSELSVSDVRGLTSTHADERPITFSREPLSRMRRVLLALVLLAVFALVALALRLTR